MRSIALTVLLLSVPLTASAQAPADALAEAVAISTRTPANIARDKYRHPAETLAFFGVQPNHTVVEIWPGGGWYTEILAPYLAHGGGKLVLAAIAAWSASCQGRCGPTSG